MEYYICWDDFRTLFFNCSYPVKINRGMTDLNCNWRLFRKSELDVIVVKLPFTYIYLFFSIHVHGMTTPLYWHSMGLLYSLHFQSLGLLPPYDTVLQGYQYVWLWLFNVSDYLTDTVTSVIQETTVALGNLVIWSLTGTSRFLKHNHVVKPWGVWLLI